MYILRAYLRIRLFGTRHFLACECKETKMDPNPDDNDSHWQYVAAAGLAVTIASLATIKAVSQRENETVLSDLMKNRIAIVTGAR